VRNPRWLVGERSTPPTDDSGNLGVGANKKDELEVPVK